MQTYIVYRVTTSGHYFTFVDVPRGTPASMVAVHAFNVHPIPGVARRAGIVIRSPWDLSDVPKVPEEDVWDLIDRAVSNHVHVDARGYTGLRNSTALEFGLDRAQSFGVEFQAIGG
jgi:hypothetical protein